LVVAIADINNAHACEDPNRPWRNCFCFVTCDEACGNGKMIGGADQRRQ
jgi:hypothetical protein